MKTRHHYYSRLFLTAVLTGNCFLFVSTGKLSAQTPTPAAPPVDPATHAAHLAAGTHPATTAPDAVKGDPALSQLQAKVAQLEAALAKGAPPMAAAPAGAAMPGMPAAAPSTSPAMGMGMDKMKPGAPMPGMSSGATPAPPMAGMNMMGMMDKMMGMMDKMMSMGGGSMPAAPAPAMSGGGGMGMDKMEMAGMMGMGAMAAAAPGIMPQSALPGFPGASHLYHIGSTDFFLDHPQHIALTTEQQAALNKAKEQAALAKSTADRAVEQAEQELWTLTAAEQPNATQVEAKIRAIEKLRGDERLSFIRAVGDASKFLTDEQRKTLTGFAPPTPAAAAMPMPAAAPTPDSMAGGMKDM